MLRRICWVLFFSVSTYFAQAEGNLPRTGDCTITLWMKNPIGREIIVDIEPISFAPRFTTRKQKKILLDDKNKGVLKIPLEGPSTIKLMMVWLDSTVSYIAIPGVDMVIHLDGLRKDTTNYDDIGPKENDFYFDILTKSLDHLKEIPQQNPELFLKKWEQEQNAMQKLVADAATGMSPVYISWISQSIQSLFQSKLCRQFVT